MEQLFIDNLLSEDKINKRELIMAKGILKSSNIKYITEILLKKGIISEKTMFNGCLSTFNDIFFGFFNLELQDFIIPVFLQKNPNESTSYDTILFKFDDVFWNKAIESFDNLEKLEKKGIFKTDQFFVLTSRPFKLFDKDNPRIKKMKEISKNENLKIFLMDEKKLLKLISNGRKEKQKILKLFDEINLSKNDTDKEISQQKEMLSIRFKSFFEYSIEAEISDIHIEPFSNNVVIRIRQDGVLQYFTSLKKNLLDPSLNVIKSLSNSVGSPHQGFFNLSHKFFGAAKFLWTENSTIQGEHIVIRILSDNSNWISLDSINYTEIQQKLIKKLIQEPNGIILVTGPNDSGKTTTISRILKEASNSTRKILSIEENIEKKIPITQQIDANFSNSDFHSYFNSVFNQDPDIIFLGEIKEKSISKKAVKGAMTGHLILGTLNSNGSLETILRLKEIGMDKTDISNTLKGVISQKLIRVLCNGCKKPVSSDALLKDSVYQNFSIDANSKNVYECNLEGCKQCDYIGYKGRKPLVEVLFVDSAVRNSIENGESIKKIKEEIKNHGFKPMIILRKEMVENGQTDIKEVIRILGSSHNESQFNYEVI